MSFSVAGKTAIVTGAANGVGLAIARHLADAGANVMFADKDETSLRAELGDIVDDKGNIRYFAGDLRENLAVANLLSATLDAFDQVDILVNGARQVVRTSPLDPNDESMSVKLSQLVARRMIKQGKDSDKPCIGTIVNLSSIAAQRTQSELMAFSVSCAALDQMTRSLAVSLAPERVRVNAVAFGSVMSASLQDYLRENPDHRDAILSATPQGRIAGPKEVAEAVQFLASDSSAFVTGEILTVDGGRSLIDAVSTSLH
jgi:7-alpha-hydroxysteroid dehydrogenase